MQTRKGQEIEDESMQIIESEIGSHTFNEMEWPIVRRIIHSTADFDFARENKLLFHKDAISNGINALKNGCSIVTDVNGVIGLMNKQNPKDFASLIFNLPFSKLKLNISSLKIIIIPIISSYYSIKYFNCKST